MVSFMVFELFLDHVLRLLIVCTLLNLQSISINAWTICLCDLLYLSHNAFVAGSTVALCCGAYANLLQVRAQPSQKIIYSICFLAHSWGLYIWTFSAAALLIHLRSSRTFPFYGLFLFNWRRRCWRCRILNNQTKKQNYLLVWTFWFDWCVYRFPTMLWDLRLQCWH